MKENLDETIEFIEGSLFEYQESRIFFTYTLGSTIKGLFEKDLTPYSEILKGLNPTKSKKITNEDIQRIEDEAEDILNLFRKEG